MQKDIYFNFEGEESRRMDVEHLLKRLQGLYNDLKSAGDCKSVKGGRVSFSLNYLMTDILDCLDLLTFNNLSRLIGIENATKIWPEVKK